MAALSAGSFVQSSFRSRQDRCGDPTQSEFPPDARLPHAPRAIPMLPSKATEKKNVRRRQSAIRNKGLVRSLYEVGILQVDVGETMPRRRKVDQPPTGADKGYPVDQDKVAQVISTELRLSPSAVWPKGVAITPALAMTTSNGSPLARSLSARARTLLRLARSSATSSKLPPLSLASFRTCTVNASALFKSRAAPTTWAPWAARARGLNAKSGRSPGNPTRFAVHISTG